LKFPKELPSLSEPEELRLKDPEDLWLRNSNILPLIFSWLRALKRKIKKLLNCKCGWLKPSLNPESEPLDLKLET
jgi:hypothetical protein